MLLLRLSLPVRFGPDNPNDPNGEPVVNVEANLVAHAVLGAVVAQMQGNSALAGASGATVGEFIAQQMYPGVKRADLTEEQRQTISSLSTLAAGLAGGLTGDSSANAVAGAQAGKNAAENNTLKEFEKDDEELRKEEHEMLGALPDTGHPSIVQEIVPPGPVVGMGAGSVGVKGESVSAANGTTGSPTGQQTKLTPEIETKILAGQRIDGSNKIIGGHSPNINDANPKYAVETMKVNTDGTRTVKYTTQFEDGNLSKIKTSTLFPEGWSDESIIDSINKIGNTSAIGQRATTGETLYRGTVNGVEIDVIKKGNEITAGYPVGGKPTPGFNPIK